MPHHGPGCTTQMCGKLPETGQGFRGIRQFKSPHNLDGDTRIVSILIQYAASQRPQDESRFLSNLHLGPIFRLSECLHG